MIIAQISDTHIALDTPDADRRIRDFERTIDDINSLDPAPDVIIHTGDIVHNGTLDEYVLAATIMSKAKLPIHLMVGNKDDRFNLRKTFSSSGYLASNPDFVSYAIEKFSVRLLMLDTLHPGSNKGDFCEDRISDLVDLIGTHPERPTAVFAHHPPFHVSEGPDPLHFQTDEIMQRFRRALQRSASIVGIFCGHVHRGVAGVVGNIPVLVVPSIATTLRKGEYPPELTTCPIYHLHKYDPDWGFSSEIRIVRDQ